VSNIGYVLTWNEQINYQYDLSSSGLSVARWFSPLGWVNSQLDPTGKAIVNFAAYTYFGQGIFNSW